MGGCFACSRSSILSRTAWRSGRRPNGASTRTATCSASLPTRSLCRREHTHRSAKSSLVAGLTNEISWQEDEEGAPVVDLAQLVHSLNKLDVGHPGRALLSGRDGEVLLVSHKDVRAVLERSFAELAAAVDDGAM